MSDNWVVQNLEKALNVWNDKLSEIWQLITQSPPTSRAAPSGMWYPASTEPCRPLAMLCWYCSL